MFRNYVITALRNLKRQKVFSFFIALFTVIFLALKAAVADPVKSLKYE